MLKHAKTMLMGVAVAVLLALPMAEGADSEEKGAERDSRFIPGDRRVLDTIAAAGTWKGEIGTQFLSEEYDADEFVVDGDPENSAGAGWAYLDLSWQSEPVYDTQIGLRGLAIGEVWQSKGFNEDNDFFDEGGMFENSTTWTEGYLRHQLSPETYVLAGRAEDGTFGEPTFCEGDYFQGVGLFTSSIPRVNVRAHVVNEVLDDGTHYWDRGGVDSRWAEQEEASLGVGRNVEADTSSRFGSVAYTGMVDIEAIRDLLTITPYVQHHSRVATKVGTDFEAEYRVDDALTVGVNGAWANYLEDTPDELWPHDEDFRKRLLRAYGRRNGLEVGGGFYSISNDSVLFTGPPGSGQFRTRFPDVILFGEARLLEGEVAEYSQRQGSTTLFADMAYSWGPISVKVMYGVADGALADAGGVGTNEGEGAELNIELRVDITEDLEGQLFYADVQDRFAGDGEQGLDILAGGLSASF